MESLLWLSPPPSPAPLLSTLRSEQKPSVPSQSPVSPREQPVSCSPVSAHSLKIVPSHLPGGACSRGHASCLQGLTGAPWRLLSAVSLSARRTSGPEMLRSTAICCASSAVLPTVFWASSGGRSTSLGHVARGGVSAQVPPSASPLLLPHPLSSFPFCLYFYSLNSAESSAF